MGACVFALHDEMLERFPHSLQIGQLLFNLIQTIRGDLAG